MKNYLMSVKERCTPHSEQEKYAWSWSMILIWSPNWFLFRSFFCLCSQFHIQFPLNPNVKTQIKSGHSKENFMKPIVEALCVSTLHFCLKSYFFLQLCHLRCVLNLFLYSIDLKTTRNWEKDANIIENDYMISSIHSRKQLDNYFFFGLPQWVFFWLAFISSD